MATEIISLIMNFVDNASKGLDAVSSKVDGFKGRVDKLAGAFAPVSLAAGAAFGLSIKAAADFDKSIQSAAKAMDLTNAQTAKFKITVQDLQKELKYAFSQSTLADIAASAGKLGVASKDVDDFTKTIAKLAVATDQTKNIDKLATDGAKISSVFKLSVPQLQEFGDAVNALDDRFPVTSAELLNFTKRVAGISQASKIGAKDAAAYGAALIGSGSNAYASATFFNVFATKLGAAANLSDKAKGGIEKLGYSADSLAKSFDKNANGTMLEFLQRVKQLDTISQKNVLGQIFGLEHVDTATLLLGQLDVLKSSLKQVGDNAGNAAKTQAEFDRQTNSLAGQMEKFKNLTNSVGIALGNILLPGIVAVLGAISPLLESLVKLTQQSPMISTLIVTALGAVALITPILMIVSAITTLVGLLPILGGAFAAVGAAIAAISAPALIVIGIITAIGAAAFVIIKNWQPISAFFVNLWNGAISAGQRFLTWINAGLNSFVANANKFINNFATAANNGINYFVNGAVSKINGFINWLGGLGNNFANMAVSWGAGLIQGFVRGLESMYGYVQSAMNNFTSWLSQYLPHSDAQRGALSNLTASGQSFVDTFMSGIDGARVDPFASMALSPASISPNPAMYAGGASSTQSAPVTVTYNITARDAEDIMKQIKERDRTLLDIITKATTRTDRRAY